MPLVPALPLRTRARISDRASCDVIETLDPRLDLVGRGVEAPPAIGVIERNGSGVLTDKRLGLGAGVG